MKLTTKSEYSLLALIYLARLGPDEYGRSDDIAAHYGLPQRYLENLLSVLKSSGYVSARRGAAGGYQLGRPAASISIAEVVRLLDGALAPIESVSVYFYSETPLQKEPRAIDLLRDVRDYISNLLEKTTLADLAGTDEMGDAR